MKGVVKLRTKPSGCVLYATLFGNVWIPVLYDPSVLLVTTVYPKNLVDFYRRRIVTIDEFLQRVQMQSGSAASSREEIATAVAVIKAQERELNAIRKLRQ